MLYHKYIDMHQHTQLCASMSLHTCTHTHTNWNRSFNKQYLRLTLIIYDVLWLFSILFFSFSYFKMFVTAHNSLSWFQGQWIKIGSLKHTQDNWIMLLLWRENLFATAKCNIGETSMKGKLWSKASSWPLIGERVSATIGLIVLSQMMKGMIVVLE